MLIVLVRFIYHMLQSHFHFAIEKTPVETHTAAAIGQDAPTENLESLSAHKVRQVFYYCMRSRATTATKQKESHSKVIAEKI